MGAAGRDFHNFNTVYRDDPAAEVVAFTAAQIPGIEGRRYPAALAGTLYPDGIPIVDEAELEDLVRRDAVDRVVFAYSDVTHETVMHKASRVLAAGADFVLLGPHRTMLRAKVPVIAVTAVRTGCGKSQVSRWLSRYLRERGLRVAAIRHPMPYGDLARQTVQRFESVADLDIADCTIEEREEYEPHIALGNLVFAGVDYAAIVESAAKEADLILWDGGNNDFSFIRPDLNIVLVDALRPDQLTTHHPGEAALRMADVVVINKVDAAGDRQVAAIERAVRGIDPEATIVRAASPVTLDDPDAVEGRRVLVVEDGPTITHGGMPHGAGYVAAKAAGAAEILDPRPFASPEVAEVFRHYPHIGPVLPAIGYGAAQIAALEATIEAADADLVVAATPIDFGRLIATDKPLVRARYAYAEAGEPTLADVVDGFAIELETPC
ncbi:MAG: cyclic 2,3-diphosphoglycerate synthase [Alphaproteobacteria bacterium]|nr:cyclic 2,3-diphosphoglycerate synthase [Alphaproteobacteria bacterium]